MDAPRHPVPRRRCTPPPCPQPRERRREPRRARAVEVDLETAAGVVYVGTTLDLSLGGMCLELGAPLTAGELVHVRFRLPGSYEPVATTAEVRWVRDLVGGLVLAGLSLPALPTRDLRILRAFLEEEAWATVSATGAAPTAPVGGPATSG